MKVLAIDVGHGTQDNYLYDSDKNEENCIKVIFPSPSKRLADEVRRSKGDIFVHGSQIGGGEFSYALLERSAKVFMTEECAYTIRNDLNEVREKGITIVEEKPLNCKDLFISEPDFEPLIPLLKRFEDGAPDAVAIAVQDHGLYPEGQSNRKERLKRIRERLEQSRDLSSLLFDYGHIPQYYTRMRSAARNARTFFENSEIFLMDTAIAAIAGAAADKDKDKDKGKGKGKGKDKGKDNAIVINLGNGHTMCAAIENGKVAGMFEHHTRKLDGEKIKALVKKFIAQELGDEEVFADGGHGCFYLSDFKEPEEIVVTGPNRKMIESSGLGFKYAYPMGDAMMSGPAGLIREIIEIKRKESFIRTQ